MQSDLKDDRPSECVQHGGGSQVTRHLALDPGKHQGSWDLLDHPMSEVGCYYHQVLENQRGAHYSTISLNSVGSLIPTELTHK